ncbi:MAG TPA: phosphoribosylformylglycinamidine cyclo-ligase [Candidatus Limnocylindrales bacterium]|nr:phosphoribosylformylglycinamidine cyclo-ligase [Candidatus Limnocylindrales bacterium]
MKASSRPLTYRTAGVDIDAADRFVSRIGKIAAATRQPGVLAGIGPFAAAVAVPKGMRQPVMVSSTDGVGTKLAVARLADRHDTIGIDLVAMNANDLVTTGARPLFFLDYLAVGVLASVDAEAIVRGIAQGCRQAGMSLVGGETAEMPGFYKRGEYDLAGFCVGAVERRSMIDGSGVRSGDVILGLESSGLHSNGYSLARRALKATTRASLARRVPELGTTLADELLKPTVIYVRPLLELLGKMKLHAMAHITGGGLSGNLVRVLPQKARAVISRRALPQLPVFTLIRECGRIRDEEMERTFNCGTGFVVIVPERDADAATRLLRRRGIGTRAIGVVERGPRSVVYSDD